MAQCTAKLDVEKIRKTCSWQELLGFAEKCVIFKQNAKYYSVLVLLSTSVQFDSKDADLPACRLELTVTVPSEKCITVHHNGNVLFRKPTASKASPYRSAKHSC